MIKDNTGSDSTPDNPMRQFCRRLPYSWSIEGSLNFMKMTPQMGLRAAFLMNRFNRNKNGISHGILQRDPSCFSRTETQMFDMYNKVLNGST